MHVYYCFRQPEAGTKAKISRSEIPKKSKSDEYFSMKCFNEAEFKLIIIAKLTTQGKTQLAEYIP